MCSHLGGTMALNYIQEPKFVIGNSSCQIGPNRPKRVWIPFLQRRPVENKRGQYHWHDDRPGFNGSEVRLKNWMPAQPNGELLQQCVEIEADKPSEQNQMNDEICQSRRCSLCKCHWFRHTD